MFKKRRQHTRNRFFCLFCGKAGSCRFWPTAGVRRRPASADFRGLLGARCLAAGAPLTLDEKRASFVFIEMADYREGMTAFLGKRPPRFTGQ